MDTLTILKNVLSCSIVQGVLSLRPFGDEVCFFLLCPCASQQLEHSHLKSKYKTEGQVYVGTGLRIGSEAYLGGGGALASTESLDKFQASDSRGDQHQGADLCLLCSV